MRHWPLMLASPAEVTQFCRVDMAWRVGLAGNWADHTVEDLVVAGRHLEDLEIFVGQRSRLHPGLGWDVVLQMLRNDLATVQTEIRSRGTERPIPQ